MMASPGASPVVASIPEGTSRATMGASDPFAQRITGENYGKIVDCVVRVLEKMGALFSGERIRESERAIRREQSR